MLSLGEKRQLEAERRPFLSLSRPALPNLGSDFPQVFSFSSDLIRGAFEPLYSM